MAESLDDDLPNGWKPPAYTRQRCLRCCCGDVNCRLAGWRAISRLKSATY
jgi:hypothetical protein